MTSEDIKKHARNIAVCLEQRKLKDVFDSLSLLLSNLQNWQLKEQLNELEQTYKAMLSYVSEGIEDPQRNKVYQNLIRSAYGLSDHVLSQLQVIDSPGYYYDRKRIFKQAGHYPALEQLVVSLEESLNKQALNSLLEQENEQTIQIRKELESTTKLIFNYIWLGDDLGKENKQILSGLLSDQINSHPVQCLIITALTLNLQETFDENKIELLLESCDNKNEEIRQRAIIGVLLAFRKYDYRLYLYPEIYNRWQHLSEDKSFIKSVVTILLQFILSKDTEKITRRINEELIPEMMKINPILSEKIKLEDLMSDSGMDDKNPEWQNFIEEAGLSDKLQEFSELQMSGADVMHSSFAHLKTYPFFNEISNWFLPFSADNTEFSSYSEVAGLKEFSDAIIKSPFLCNSDKYSLYLSVVQMPESFRKMMTGQFSAEASAIKEMQETELPDAEKQSKNIASQYIRDLYRFYKLSSKRRGIQDIFDGQKEFYQSENIFQMVSTEENMQIIGEYYFNKDHYKEAADIFDKLLKLNPNNDTFFQKRAYCMQMQGKIEEALNDYLIAEALNPSNSWVIKKIASCYKMLKKPEDALIYYRKTEQQNPENLSTQLNIGHCFLELKNYQEALKCYYKVEFLDKNESRAWRPIAWCSFLAGKYEQSLDYYEKILNHKPESLDYLNTGHVYLVTKNIKKAIQLYVSAAKNFGSFAKFSEVFNEDLSDLIAAGVEESNIPLLLDLVQYDDN
ncbi:MAG: hypothetical protein LBI82_08395 [Dysgonamonadaceae bacterium]|jgi:tetratricopeptide (TPR) repeat protein|nr:hypothetical protein [Dysgonamonadaceae bacterium]